MLFEAGIEVLLLILLLRGFQALLLGFGLIRGSVGIHDTHVANTVRPLIPDIYDEDIPLQLPLFLLRGPSEFVLTSMNSATCVDFVVGLSCKVINPITELVVTRHDEASLFAFKGVADVKLRAASIKMVR